MNDLSNMLNNAGIGCHPYNFYTNIMSYVDYLCVTVPSHSGCQALLDICEQFGFENNFEHNLTKSPCVVFKQRGFYLKYPDIDMNLNKPLHAEITQYLGVVRRIIHISSDIYQTFMPGLIQLFRHVTTRPKV